MVSRAEFISHITDAYKHLYDLVYLRTHPLVDILIASSSLTGKKRTRQLHRILLDVIEELDPGPQVPAFSHEWRRHRLMVLRYVRGLNPQAVADQLAIGLRHYYRVHDTAIEDVASLLWDRYVVRRPCPLKKRLKSPQRMPRPVAWSYSGWRLPAWLRLTVMPALAMWSEGYCPS